MLASMYVADVTIKSNKAQKLYNGFMLNVLTTIAYCFLLKGDTYGSCIKLHLLTTG